MKRIVCYSGGHSSGLVAIEVVRRFGAENVILLNHDIAKRVEDKDIKRFKREVAEFVAVPITYCNAVGWKTKDQFDVVIEAGAFKVGNGTALCTNRMKTQPFENWLAENVKDKKATIYYGFDLGEQLRIQRRSSHLALLGFKSDYPLALWPSSRRTIYSTSSVGIARPNSYSKFKHANCTGCLKAGRQHWYVVYCVRPDIWEKGKLAEDKIGYTIIKGISLVELEPIFMLMKRAGIEPNEHIEANRFWANVKACGISTEVEPTNIPCECVD